MLFANGFDTKIVNNKGEEYKTRFMAPEASSVVDRGIAVWLEVGGKLFIGKLVSLR